MFLKLFGPLVLVLFVVILFGAVLPEVISQDSDGAVIVGSVILIGILSTVVTLIYKHINKPKG